MFEIYYNRGGLWRWRLKARNGRIMADSGEGYASHDHTRRAILRLRAFMPKAEISDAR